MQQKERLICKAIFWLFYFKKQPSLLLLNWEVIKRAPLFKKERNTTQSKLRKIDSSGLARVAINRFLPVNLPHSGKGGFLEK